MAMLAKMDQEERTVEVERLQLIEQLKINRKNHVREYELAKDGYKTVLLLKITEAFKEAELELQKRHKQAKLRVADLTEADIAKQPDTVRLVEAITIEMKVPRSFAKEYDAAIDMAEWDVRPTLTLTHAEFTCFVRDQWDWKSGFEAVSAIYNKTLRR